MGAARGVLGIFVGGRGRRMGGVQKALLRAPDSAEPLVTRLARIGRALDLEVVLVGAAELGDASAGLVQLADAADIGPLGGLLSLLAHAGARPALGLACDMPFVSSELLARLANEAPQAALLAPRDPQTGKWQALFARYAGARVSPFVQSALERGEHSFQTLFERVPAVELSLAPSEHAQLRDWDTPDDVQG
jgi:molybdopterin-guanine dinucleotide biosynthesis protein A